MYTVYVIESTTRKYRYVGITKNLERRLSEHNVGSNKTTSPYKPFILKHTESFDSRMEARKREMFFKSGEGRELLTNLIS